eukprot:scaffold26665_cov169-Skeletonema_menzelii.AAC.8
MIAFVPAAVALLISFRTSTSPFIETIKASAAVKAGEAAPFGGLCDALNQATASFAENFETNGADISFSRCYWLWGIKHCPTCRVEH